MRGTAAFIFVVLFPAALAAEPSTNSVSSAEPEWTLVAGGDVMMARTIGVRMGRNGAAKALAGVGSILSKADIAFCNLESILGTSDNEKMFPEKCYNFLAATPTVRALTTAGVDTVSLANNHAMDYNGKALSQTRLLLWKQGIYPFGAGKDSVQSHLPATFVVRGTTVAFLGYGIAHSTWVWSGASRPGVSALDPRRIRQDIRKARKGADLVVVSLHWGEEYNHYPSKRQIQLAHGLVEGGADIILGHHPHVLQGVEEYQGKVIAYSLGNLLFDQKKNAQDENILLRISLQRNRVRRVELVPVDRREVFYPAVAMGVKGEKILSDVQRYSLPLQSTGTLTGLISFALPAEAQPPKYAEATP